MILTNVMISNYETDIRVRDMKHDGQKNIVLKFDNQCGNTTLFLNEKQLEDLVIKSEKLVFDVSYSELEDKYYKEKHDREYFERQAEYWKEKFYEVS